MLLKQILLYCCRFLDSYSSTIVAAFRAYSVAYVPCATIWTK